MLELDLAAPMKGGPLSLLPAVSRLCWMTLAAHRLTAATPVDSSPNAVRLKLGP